jgi:hypothetical protein
MDKCAYCTGPLTKANSDFDNIYENHGYLYCNKLHRKYHEKELITSGKVTIKESTSRPDPYSRRLVNEDEWINGTWEHLGPEPVHITGGRKQLVEECKKVGLFPKALMKPKSQGKGWEIPTKRH